MEEWLNKLWDRWKNKKVGFVVLFLLVLLAILTIVALLSDIGFSDEVKSNRIWILKIAVSSALIIVFAYVCYRIYNLISGLKQRIQELEGNLGNVEQERDSALRLMERYRAEAQESIFNKLKQLAIFGIKQQEWKTKGAKVDRFRIEQISTSDNSDISTLIEHITVLINVGLQDDVLKGMRFIVQDPTDSQKYGVILVKETYDAGAACTIVETNHQAFWVDVIQNVQLRNGGTRILTAHANVIVPSTYLKEINPESAKQLLEWVQTLEGTEL